MPCPRPGRPSRWNPRRNPRSRCPRMARATTTLPHPLPRTARRQRPPSPLPAVRLRAAAHFLTSAHRSRPIPRRNREPADMQVWAIANQKGGVGKTTTTLFLGRGLAQAGHRVLLIDLDPHASLTRAFAVPANPPPSGTHDLFGTSGASLASLARSTDIEGLRLVAAQPALATLERRGATQPGLGLALGRALHGVHATFDYVLLDCPPTLGLLM